MSNPCVKFKAPKVKLIKKKFWVSAVGGHYDMLYLCPSPPELYDEEVRYSPSVQYCDDWILPKGTWTICPSDFIFWFGGEKTRDLLIELGILNKGNDDRPFSTDHENWVELEVSYMSDEYDRPVGLDYSIDGYL